MTSLRPVKVDCLQAGFPSKSVVFYCFKSRLSVWCWFCCELLRRLRALSVDCFRGRFCLDRMARLVLAALLDLATNYCCGTIWTLHSLVIHFESQELGPRQPSTFIKHLCTHAGLQFHVLSSLISQSDQFYAPACCYLNMAYFNRQKWRLARN